MKRIAAGLGLVCSLALGLSAAPAAKVEVTAKHGKSLRGTIDGVPFLLLRGTARERGVDHGFLAAKEILRVFDSGLVPALSFLRPGGWDKEFAQRAGRFSWPARFEDELSGMLEGVQEALPEKEGRTLRTLKRELSIADLKAANCLSDLIGMGCSSFSVWGDLTADGAMLTARNLDYTAFPMQSLYAVVAVDPVEKDLRPTVDFLTFGMVGSGTGLNVEGVFLALHDERGMVPAEGRACVPRFLSLRAALEGARAASAVADIAGTLRASPVGVGNNVHVSSPAAAGVVEWDGNAKDGGATVRAPEGNWIVCTNHYVARVERSGPKDSEGRYEKLSKAIADARGAGRKIDFEAAKSMLDSVCKKGGSVTHLSVVAWPAARRVAFAFSAGGGAPAPRGRWVEFGWDDLFKN